MTAAAPGTRFRTQGGHMRRRNSRVHARLQPQGRRIGNRCDTGLEGHDIEKTIAARYGLGKDELEGNKEALMRRVNYKQHASKASRIFQSGPAWVG